MYSAQFWVMTGTCMRELRRSQNLSELLSGGSQNLAGVRVLRRSLERVRDALRGHANLEIRQARQPA